MSSIGRHYLDVARVKRCFAMKRSSKGNNGVAGIVLAVTGGTTVDDVIDANEFTGGSGRDP